MRPLSPNRRAYRNTPFHLVARAAGPGRRPHPPGPDFRHRGPAVGSAYHGLLPRTRGEALPVAEKFRQRTEYGFPSTRRAGLLESPRIRRPDDSGGTRIRGTTGVR
ncbi:hypothetical protein GCM10010498_10370 [Streptomyces cavourensis]|nr:hypothetical protein GCM10010498_10370 [Streptomyces cavourensis]